LALLERPDVDKVQDHFGNLSSRSSGKGFRDNARHFEDLESMGNAVLADTSLCTNGTLAHPFASQSYYQCLFHRFRVRPDQGPWVKINGIIETDRNPLKKRVAELFDLV
jgi:hypothetical protein